MDMTEHNEERLAYHPALDGVRALAALLVMVFHANQQGIKMRGPISFGQTGVDLFFVLSGFLITSILYRGRQHSWTEVKVFYARRSLRIFPLYYAYLVISSLVATAPAWPFWVYLQNIWFSMHWPAEGPNHFWSLGVEEQFYLFWPFLVLFAPRRHLLPLLWIMICGAALARYLLAREHHDVFYLTLTRLDGLAAGSVLAVQYARGALFQHRRLITVSALLFSASCVGIGLLFRTQQAAWFAAMKFTLVTGMYASLLALLLTHRQGRASRVLGSSPMRFVGRISYGLYVFHPAVFGFSFALLAGYADWLRLGAGFTAVFVVSLVSWFSYERFFIRLKDRLAGESPFPSKLSLEPLSGLTPTLGGEPSAPPK